MIIRYRTTHTYRDDAAARRVTPPAVRRAIVPAALALAALCAAVLAVAGPPLVQFGACFVVGCAVVALRGRG